MISMLPVAIIAGGLGTRMRSVASDVPKALIPVNGEAFMIHQLRLLRAQGIERVVLCVGHKGEMIRESIGNGRLFGLQVEYAFDGSTLLGTAGAVRKARPLLGETFFVLYGDSYLPCDFVRVETEFRRSQKLALMTVFQNEGRWDTSNVEFVGGKILKYDKTHRTPQMRHIDYGLGLFRACAFDRIPDGQFFDLVDLYQELLRDGELAAFEVDQRFYEIGSPQGLREISEYLSQQKA